MTREEFVKKYKIGDKIKASHWSNELFLEIIFIGIEKFLAINDLGNENIWAYDECDWRTYIKPKKTIKMAQALIKNSNGNFSATDFFYTSKEKLAAVFFPSEVIQWPLVINGVEQWIEVEVEE